jgi:hypothetical protein
MASNPKTEKIEAARQERRQAPWLWAPDAQHSFSSQYARAREIGYLKFTSTWTASVDTATTAGQAIAAGMG